MPPMANVSTRPARTTFACSECGHESLKWLGRCPGCASWNTFTEVLPAPRSAATTRREGPRTEAVELSSLSGADEPRLSSGRRAVLVVSLIIFVLSFSPVPLAPLAG